MVPGLETARIEETWAGLRPDSADHLPIIGPTDVEGLLIATGHFRSGVLLAPVTARMIREWVVAQTVSVDWDRVSPDAIFGSDARAERVRVRVRAVDRACGRERAGLTLRSFAAKGAPEDDSAFIFSWPGFAG